MRCPRETASYVPIIVAMTIMAKNPKDYGLENIDLDPAVEFDDIQLTAATNLNLVADASLQPISALRDLNPALLSMVVPAGFRVHVPKEQRQRRRWRRSKRFRRRVGLPGGCITWKQGIRLQRLRRSYHVAPDRIAAVNRAADSLEAGDVLLIPAVVSRAGADQWPGGLGLGRVGKASATSDIPFEQGGFGAAWYWTWRLRGAKPSATLHRKVAVRTASLQRWLPSLQINSSDIKRAAVPSRA